MSLQRGLQAVGRITEQQAMSGESESSDTNVPIRRGTFEVDQNEYEYLQKAAAKKGLGGRERTYYRNAILHQAAVELLETPVRKYELGKNGPVVGLTHVTVQSPEETNDRLVINGETITKEDAPTLAFILQHFAIHGQMPPMQTIMKMAE